MNKSKRIISFFLCFIIGLSMISFPSVACADWDALGLYTQDCVDKWLGVKPFGGWNLIDAADALFSSKYASSKPQAYYTTPTSSTQDKYGNVTNYYRSGDTTNTQIIDSYNKTFNTIHNTTNNTTTNNYKANVKLENFLNQYTTNNNNYTYSADFKSWYYDNTTNNYNYNQFTKNDYTQNNLYYNQDNSRYYISIDNSTDEYYLIDVQYSPTFVTVNYTYNTTNINNEKVGDVTNVYYYELKDGRNSSTLTAAEVAGLDFGYDVKNYELVTDDPNTLSLQHFDGDYTDSSSFNRSYYSQNRSTNYVDSGAFGKAVSLPNGAAAGVTIPNLSSYSSLSFDFRVYYTDISKLGIYFGDTNIFQEVVPTTRVWKGRDVYSDDGKTWPDKAAYYLFFDSKISLSKSSYYDISDLESHYVRTEGRMPTRSTDLKSEMAKPTSYLSPGFVGENSYSKKYGWMSFASTSPTVYLRSDFWQYSPAQSCRLSSAYPEYGVGDVWQTKGVLRDYTDYEYRWSPSKYVLADFAYDSYKNQWVSMRVTLSGGKLYYFVNGDLVGSGSFTKPTADKFYIKSSGTVYLDELRVTTGSLSSTGTYNPSNAPYDTNKVLALPDKLTANTIYVQHNTTVTDSRIGGVRPSNPSEGFFYIPLHDDNTGGQPQLYTGGNWVNVTAMVYDGSTTKTALGYTFAPVGSSPDVDVDAKPERPVKPGQDVDPETCTHEWVECVPDSVAPTCTQAGMTVYICSKCEKQKTESVPLLDHDWMVKVTVTNQYDESGELITLGFTIYECSRCQEQYKSIDGTAPPALVNPGGSTTPGDGEEEEGFFGWLLRKIGEVLGTIGNGVLGLLQAALGKIFDGIISLVQMAFEKLTQLVDLFGSFGDALGVLWTWLPPEIMLVLVTGVTVFVFIGLLKLFMK